MKSFFNLYFSNIDENITPFQYWMFILGMFGLVIILKLLEINLKTNLDYLANILNIVFIWPTLMIITKRLNDIGSQNIIINAIIAAILTVVPGWFNLDIFILILIGIIPTDFIPNIYKRLSQKTKC